MIFIDTLSKIIGINIRNLRTETGISTEELSDILDVSPAFVGLVERGQKEVNLEYLIRISKIFDVSVDYLISETKTKEIFYKTSTEKSICKLNALVQDLDHDKIILLNTIACELRKMNKSHFSINEN